MLTQRNFFPSICQDPQSLSPLPCQPGRKFIKILNKKCSARSDNSGYNTGYESDAVSPVVRIQFIQQPNMQSRKDPLRYEAMQPGTSDNSIIQGTEF